VRSVERFYPLIPQKAPKNGDLQRQGVGGSAAIGPLLGDKDPHGNRELWPHLLDIAMQKHGYECRKPAWTWSHGGADKGAKWHKYDGLFVIYGRTTWWKPRDWVSQDPSKYQKQPIVFYTPSEWGKTTPAYNLRGNHAYYLESYYYSNTDQQWMVQLKNPWGDNNPPPIPVYDIPKYFSDVIVATP
jgi:hypothetical protein